MIITKQSAEDHLAWMDFKFNKSRIYLGVIISLQTSQEQWWRHTQRNKKP
jgi:hypothetical protein